MTLRYGIKITNKTDQVTIEAEDPLIAALKVETAHPEAAITYVRKQMPAAIDAIHTPARSIRNRPCAPHHARLSQRSRRPTAQRGPIVLGRAALLRSPSCKARRATRQPLPRPSIQSCGRAMRTP